MSGTSRMEAERELAAHIERLVAKIGASSPLGPSSGGMQTCVEIDGRGYNLVTYERGSLVHRMSERVLDTFCFLVLDEVARSLAKEMAGRPRTDHRRIWFPRHAALMHELSPAWGARAEREQRRELEKRPFDDDAFERIAQVNRFVHQGSSREEAELTADVRYPRPRRGR